MSGLECGSDHPDFCNDNPGKLDEDYFNAQRPDFERLAEEGFEGFRIPFLWERMQPHLGGPLDPNGIQALRYIISTADRLNCKVILAMHNAGHYTTRVDDQPTACGLEESIDGKVIVQSDHLVEFWSRMSHALCGLPNLHGFSLISSADELTRAAWHKSAQATVDSIRQDLNTIPIYVVGEGQSCASTWDQENPDTAWIEDPEGKVIYETTCHIDHDGSGQYQRSFDDEIANDSQLEQRAETRLTPFLTWLKTNDLHGAITDFRAPRDHQGWQALLPTMIDTLGKANVMSMCWSADPPPEDDPIDPAQTPQTTARQSSHTGLFRGKTRPA